ncbi:hypothetical protein H2198_009076 [Neophaeococcomyces mojaviensis]|uniref:Uncharacterized protein n=1 Tax=Neophaeococcomyces mojaviensis TaxID=3383035 RepID=A0ACC2ZVT8_9EURO|nr:hypothetical protein H2198_009076 [Knufia sp. JES_112]
MDSKDHITTLCALGTIGAAATGFAFATEEPDTYPFRPGKRKWPGSSFQPWTLSTVRPALPGRSVSQPHTPTLPTIFSPFTAKSDKAKSVLSTATKRLVSSNDDSAQDVPSSRGSSMSRRSILRPRTAHSKSTAEKRESGTSSNWLKRLSSLSSHSGSQASSVRTQDPDAFSNPPLSVQRPATSATPIPNKLVKRSVSHRGLSHDEARGQMFGRPATSHQRSQTFREILSRPVLSDPGVPESMIETLDFSFASLPENPTPSWKPYFESVISRKRRKSESAADSSQIRTIQLSRRGSPYMILGSHADDHEPQLEPRHPSPVEHHFTSAPPTETRRSRRSFSSLRKNTRRRNFTDPSVQLTRAAANGTISPVVTQGAVSPMSNASPFNVSLPLGTPIFNSSPPLSNYDHRSSRPGAFTTISDPPTTSSDADMHVFSDEDSLDFRSDTAYDSIATRTTNASYSGRRESKLETIFAERTSDDIEARSELWRSLREDGTEKEDGEQDLLHDSNADVEMTGIGISMGNDSKGAISQLHTQVLTSTPPRSTSSRTDDFSVTPVPLKMNQTQIYSSPPLLPTIPDPKAYDDVGEMLEDMILDEEGEVEWSPASEASYNADKDGFISRQIVSSPGGAPYSLIARFQEPDTHKIHVNGEQLKPSIFDWSEQQQVNGASRPKTVHGKQSNGDRSRSSGRKGPPQLHFRSQSVPVNREGPLEEVQTASKFPTWRLGHKPVSEEWSDDFEFDDGAEDDKTLELANVPETPNFRDSVRSVKIPQSIIDRQPSVHLQFGQVQEFMALVEGLKELRSRGGELQLLNGHAKHLWEDAEAIINLATMNDDEHENFAPSPTSSDPFAEITPLPTSTTTNISTTTRGRRPTTSTKRSVSNISTLPMHGRARGESLAQARHLLQNMHHNRAGWDSSPREIEIHQQKKLPFDTQDLKDLVVRSGVITRALKEEVRRAEGVPVSPQKTPPSTKGNHLSDIFRVPEAHETSPCPPFRKPVLPKSRSANSYLENVGGQQQSGPFSSPIALTAVVQPHFPSPTASIAW